MTAEETTAAQATTTAVTTEPVQLKTEKVEQKVEKVSYTPQEAPVEWVQQIGKGPAKKVAYQVLEWINTATGKEEKPPGKQDAQETAPKDFMAYLKDGQLLAKLGNVLHPGSIETVHEENDKEKQTSNIKSFLSVIKEKSGVSAADKVNADDVQQGKTSQFSSLLGALVQLGGNTTTNPNATGLDQEALVKIVQDYVKKGFLQQVQQLLQRVFKKNPSTKKVKEEKTVEENGKETTEKKTEIVVEETKPKDEPAPAVEAN